MLEKFLAPLMPDKPLASSARRLWSALLLTFPLAFVLGLVLHIAWQSGHHLQTSLNREKALQRGMEAAHSLGIPVDGWGQYCRIDTDRDLFLYGRKHPEAATALRVSPVAKVVVTFLSPSNPQRENLQIFLALNGSLLGYEFTTVAKSDDMIPDDEAFAIASSQLTPDFLSLNPGAPEVSTLDGVRRYTWRGNTKDIEVRFIVGVKGRRVIALRTAAELDAAVSAAVKAESGSQWQTWGWVAYAIFIAAALGYSAFRYARRSLQQEVSHSRTLLVATLSAIFMTLNFYGNIDAAVARGSNQPVFILLIINAIVFAAIGVVFGVAYSSGEGDVREAYPGKLTSLDALLLGRITSRNVAASVLVGAACSSWLFFLDGLILGIAPWRMHMEDLTVLLVPFMRQPWLSLLVGTPLIAVLIAISGLQQPIAFVHQHLRGRRRATFVFLAVSAALGVFLESGSSSTNLVEVSVRTVLLSVLLLAPFFLKDLLASIAGLTAFQFSMSILALRAVAPGYEHYFVRVGLGILTILAAAVLLIRGRYYREEEVRPKYAKYIAERQALEAEVSAAREAQLRLLPQSIPVIPGLSIAASCTPARVVGGDFYDFFVLSENRIGVFVAEGGNRGLAAALSIALAKGFLMHCVQRCLSPTEVVVRLETALGAILESAAGKASLAYAVIDTETGNVEYGRTGVYPRVLTVAWVEESGKLETTQSERMIAARGRAEPLTEGRATLKAGDHVFFYTDGIARQFERRRKGTQEAWLCDIAADSEAVHEAHDRLIAAVAHHSDDIHEADDLTAVVIRVERLGQRTMEGVA